MKVIKIFVFLFLFSAVVGSFLSGAETKEINDMTIISGAAFNLNPETGQYNVTAEIASDLTGESRVLSGGVITGSGTTVADAMKKLIYSDTKETWLSHAQVFVIGKDLAGSGISPVLDYAIRNYEARLSVNLVIAAMDDVSAIWQRSDADTGSAAFEIDDLLSNSRTYSESAGVRLYQAVDTLNSQGISLTVPVISIKENSPVLAGTAIFRKDQLKGFISQEETLYLLFLLNRVEQGHISLPDGLASADIESTSTTLTPDFNGNTLTVYVDIKTDAVISQLNSTGDSMPTKDALQEAFSETIAQGCRDLTKRLQEEFRTDAAGFGRAVYYSYPDAWANLGKNWDTGYFPGLSIVIRCETSLDLGEAKEGVL